MAVNIENDIDEQFFYQKAMLQTSGARTVLLGVVDSKKFADSDVDYFVGEGVLAGIIGVASASTTDLKLDAEARWKVLRQKIGLQITSEEGPEPLFCWMDPDQPRTTGIPSSAQWLELEDVVGPSSSETENEKPMHPGIPRAGLAILLKICGALVQMDYPPNVVRNVGALVRRNLMTAVHHGNLPLKTECSQGDEEWLKMRIGAVLTCMLDSNGSRTQSVNMNSNEPVLLINNFGGLSHDLVRDIVSMSVQQLQHDWNVWPVRVYAGPYLAGEVDEERRQYGFSLTLLNVVNTDIGGPSMIDLLDQACQAPIWSYSFNSFFKETWRDRQLIDRFETEAPISRSSSSDSLSQKSQQSVESEVTVQAFDSSELPAIAEQSAEMSRSEPQGKPDEDSSSPPAEVVQTAPTSTTSPTRDDGPAEDEAIWDDVRARYVSREDGRDIVHPTFEHAMRRESLLDLIRSQSEGGRRATDSEGSNIMPEGAEVQTEKSSEEEFVVV